MKLNKECAYLSKGFCQQAHSNQDLVKCKKCDNLQSKHLSLYDVNRQDMCPNYIRWYVMRDLKVMEQQYHFQSGTLGVTSINAIKA